MAINADAPRPTEGFLLRAWGQVTHTLEWNLPAFRRLPAHSCAVDAYCSKHGWHRKGEQWTGLSSRELIARVRPLPDATWVMAHGAGGFRAGMSLATFAGPDVLLAWSHDGAELDDERGGPIRLVVSGQDCCKSVKGIEGIEFLNKNWPDSMDELV